MDGDYSKKVWIIGIILAILCLGIDVAALLDVFGAESLMKQTCMVSIPISGYVLFKCITGLKKKLDEEKSGK